MNPIIVQIGSFEIRWYSLLILCGVIIAYFLINHEAKKYNAEKDFIFNLTFWTVLFGLLGARLYYVIFNWSLYSHDLLSIFKFWEGGLAIHGGILFGIITIYVYCKKKNVNFIKILDIAAPALLIAQAIGRWGNFFNSEAHGYATTLAELKNHIIVPDFVINGMNINGIYYEPTFYYESLWCILGFILLLIIRNRKKTKLGTLTALYFIWYSLGRFFIERMRTDSLMLGGLKVAQLVSIMLFILGIVLLIINYRKKDDGELYQETNLNKVNF